MLGREGPSIQLGAMGGKGLAKKLALSPVEERALIASGAAAGLAAAFNAPIAGLLFVVEEVYHHFSRVFWVSTLAASLVKLCLPQYFRSNTCFKHARPHPTYRFIQLLDFLSDGEFFWA